MVQFTLTVLQLVEIDRRKIFSSRVDFFWSRGRVHSPTHFCGPLSSPTFGLSVAEVFCEQEQLFPTLVPVRNRMCCCLSQISRTRFAGRLREASRTANPLCRHVAPRNTTYFSSPSILRASPLSSKSLGRPSVLLLTIFMSQLWHSFELAQLCSV